MWISEEAARERIRSSQNILNRVNRDEKPPEDYPVPIPAMPSDVLEGEVVDGSNESPADLSPAEEAEILAAEAVLASTPHDEIAPDVLKRLHGLVNKRPKGRLTKRETADAILTSKFIGRPAAAALFDRSPHTLRVTEDFGNQGHYNRTPDSELVRMIEEDRNKIRKAAFDRLDYVLQCLSNEKIKKVEKARELAGIATQLAGVAEKMLPREMQNEDRTVFHIFRPEVKQQSDYEIVEVGEER